MAVLIVEPEPEQGNIWREAALRDAASATLLSNQEQALTFLRDNSVRLIVMNLVLHNGSALAVSDYAQYRYPQARVIFVTNSSFFSDGSIFRHSGNACALVPRSIATDDLAAMIGHYRSLS